MSLDINIDIGFSFFFSSLVCLFFFRPPVSVIIRTTAQADGITKTHSSKYAQNVQQDGNQQQFAVLHWEFPHSITMVLLNVIKIILIVRKVNGWMNYQQEASSVSFVKLVNIKINHRLLETLAYVPFSRLSNISIHPLQFIGSISLFSRLVLPSSSLFLLLLSCFFILTDELSCKYDTCR